MDQQLQKLSYKYFKTYILHAYINVPIPLLWIDTFTPHGLH